MCVYHECKLNTVKMDACKSVWWAAVSYCATLVHIHTYTHRQHFDQLIPILQPANLKVNKLKDD